MLQASPVRGWAFAYTARAMRDCETFLDLYRHGFVRAAVAVPEVRVANPEFNARESVRLLDQAAGQGACLVAFPELGLSAYTGDDLFHQQALLQAAERAL